LAAYETYQFHTIYQLILNFCTVELGSFYLDVIKDRQYTCQTNSKARRSTQTAMYHVLEALTRWLAPILTFTAEEIWQQMPGEREASVLFNQWYPALQALPTDITMGDIFWNTVLQLKDTVGPKLEALRNDKTIGSSLDAEVDLYCDKALYSLLENLEDELRFALITSYARIHPIDKKPADANTEALPNGTELVAIVTPSEYAKCVRCWHHREDVGSHSDHPELCGRCVENIEGAGEERRYA
jgi:isoleucyl-tRNA synthetase